MPFMVSIGQVPSFNTKITLEHEFQLQTCFIVILKCFVLLVVARVTQI